jgi:TolB protein
VINVDGTGLRRVTRGWEPAWSPDGRTLVFRDTGIEVIDIDGSNHRLLYDDEGYGSFHPAWSPDGRRIAFTVGTYISEFPPLGMWVINPDGSDARRIGLCDGELPVWSPDSSEIAFRDGLGRH